MTLVIDPTSEISMQILPSIHMFLNGRAPIRFGYLFHCPEPNPFAGKARVAGKEGKEEPLCNVIASVFYHLYRRAGPTSASQFLASVCRLSFYTTRLKIDV
jgi:hypothetical protein